jgi:hypothetical protein
VSDHIGDLTAAAHAAAAGEATRHEAAKAKWVEGMCPKPKPDLLAHLLEEVKAANARLDSLVQAINAMSERGDRP